MRKLVGCLFFFFCLTTQGLAVGGFDTTKHILDNGMPVIITEMPGNPMVSVYGLVKAGAATEEPFLGSGISHFVEHMLFKSTEKRDVGTIAPEVQAMGGDVNASTSLDFTIYTLTVPADRFEEALDILADMLTSAKFDPEEVEKEREVIFREMDLHNVNPARRLSRLTFENVYKQHPYQHPTIGYKDLFAKISRDDLYTYYKTHYIPNNMVFSVAGNVQTETVLPLIQKRFKDFSRRNYLNRVLPQEPDQVVERFAQEPYNVPYAHVSMAFPSVRLMDKDLYALDLLAHILGIGSTSRLSQDLYYDRKLVYHLRASNFTPVDQGAFEIEFNAETQHIDEVKYRVLEHIKKVQKAGVRKEELKRAKVKVRTKHVISQQHTSSIAWSQALDEAFAGDYDFSEEYVQGISKVTSDDIQRVARQYLNPPSLSMSVIYPEEEEGVQKAEIQTDALPQINKYVLANGLTVLLKENPIFPIFTMRLSMEAGTRQEGEHFGVSNTTGHLWLKGTKKKDRVAIQEYISERGMSLGFVSGKNSLSLYATALPEYMDDALDIFSEIVFTPTFPHDELDHIVTNKKKALLARDVHPFSLTQHTLYKTLFPTHPFGRDKQGTAETLDRMTRGDIKAFYENMLYPENMVLTILGDFDEEEILKRLKKEFGTFRKEKTVIKTFTEEPIKALRTKTNILDKEQAIVMFGFHGPTIYDEDYYPARVASSILGSSFSGRMFGRIRDKLSKAYTLGGGLAGGIDAGAFTFHISTTEENIDDVIELMNNEFEDMQNHLVTEKELKDMTTYLKGIHKSALQTDIQLVERVNLDELYGIGYDDYTNYDHYIDAVTREDIRRIAQKYWSKDQMAIVITRPSPEMESDE